MLFTFFVSGSLARRLLPSPSWQLPRTSSTFTDCLSYLSLPMARDDLWSSFFDRPAPKQRQRSTSTGPMKSSKDVSYYASLHRLWRLHTPTICRRSKLSHPQGAMQAFLICREDSSHEARSTKKQIYVNSLMTNWLSYSSHCPRCHSKKSLLTACHFRILKLLDYLDLC